MERRCECSESHAIWEISFGLFLLMFNENGEKEIPLVSAPGPRQLVLGQSCLHTPGAAGPFPALTPGDNARGDTFEVENK